MQLMFNKEVKYDVLKPLEVGEVDYLVTGAHLRMNESRDLQG